MTSTTNAPTILADSLAQFSKAAYNAITELENQCRVEVLRAESETRKAREETRKAKEESREAKNECDKFARDLHAASLDAQRWKQAATDAKATLDELRREFLRVEQERYAQSSRIDDLLNLQYTHSHTVNSAPSSMATGVLPSPTKPPSYKSAVPLSTSDTGSCSDISPLPAKSGQTNHGTLKRQRDVPPANSSEEAPGTNRNSSKRKTKANSSINAAAGNSQPDPQSAAASRTTLIRRVQAVVHVKREESDDDSTEDLSAATNIIKDNASTEDEIVGANRRLSRRRRKTINDDDAMEQHYLAADGNPVKSRHLRHRNAIVNYREDEDEDDEDELTMGAEENHEEVYGTQRIETLGAQRSKQQKPDLIEVAAPPPKKKCKLAAR